MRALLPRILLATSSLAFALLLAEGVLRLVPSLDPHLGGHERLFTFDPVLGWRFVPNAQETVVFPGEYRRRVRINAAGFRDVAWTDTPGARRVAILGDSFTTNLGVEADSVFTRQLEALWPGTVVRNYGVNGYNQTQELLLLESDVLAWTPDRVLVLLYPRNDLDENATRTWTAHYRRPRATLGPDSLRIDTDLPPHTAVVEHSWTEGLRLRSLARTLRYRLRPDDAPLHARPPERRWSRTEWSVDEQEAFDLTIALVERMKTRCDAAGVAFGVVLAPSLWQVRDDAWARIADEGMIREEPQKTLATILTAWGIDVLDLLPILRARDERLYYPSEQHWTTAAQRPVARAIAERWPVPPRNR